MLAFPAQTEGQATRRISSGDRRQNSRRSCNLPLVWRIDEFGRQVGLAPERSRIFESCPRERAIN